MKSKTNFAIALLALMVLFSLTAGKAQAQRIPLTVSPGKLDCANVPVHATVTLPAALAHIPAEEISVELRQQDSQTKVIPGQIVTGPNNEAQLWWILPQVHPGKESTWIATLSRRKPPAKNTFSWKDTKGEYLDLLFDGRKMTRYMYAYDTSTKQRTFETYKPFHHVFDEQGKNLLTNGPDGASPYQNILYPHHRGIFIGWSKLEFAGQTYNLWGMNKGTSQRHRKTLLQTAGPVLAVSETLIHWNDPGGAPIIAERRRATAYRQSEPTILLLDLDIQLQAVKGDVFLNGDSEHGGFQYRAHNDIASGKRNKKGNATYLFHQDNINPKQDKNLPWAALSYPLNDRSYSVGHMNHPANPRPVVYSAYRGYGRFGTFFKQKIASGKTLTLRYRFWIVESDMPARNKFADRYEAFVNPPQVTPIPNENAR